MHQSPRLAVPALEGDVTVVVSCYKRPQYLIEHLRAVEGQSVRPAGILIWATSTDSDLDQVFDSAEIREALAKYPVAHNTHNFGVWGRFAFALLADTEFVCIIDDDQIPGSRWLENCLRSYRELGSGIFGAIGLIFDPKRPNHVDSKRVGVFQPREVITQVDVLGHSWFMHRDALAAFWKEAPNRVEHPRAGENIHLAHMAQKYLGLGCYVPPMPKHDTSLWATNLTAAKRYGRDSASIYQNEGHTHMDAYLRMALSSGFELLRSRPDVEAMYQDDRRKEAESMNEEIRRAIEHGGILVIVGRKESRHEIWPGCEALPFLERDGDFWGYPANDMVAIEEAERMRADGAGALVFPRDAFWWFDKYPKFRDYVRSRFECVIESDSCVVFDLGAPSRDVSAGPSFEVASIS